MINKLIALAARFTIGKHLVAGIAYAHNKLDGNRSEISLGVLALVHLLKVVGIVPEATAGTIELALSAILPVTLADKFSKAKAAIDSIIPKQEFKAEEKPGDSESKAI